MTAPDDLQLLRALREGDTQACHVLYQRHSKGLYRFALLHGGRAEVAADVVQEVFMGLLNDSYRFDPLRGMLGHFLYGVARKLMLRHAGESGRRVQHVDEDEDEHAGEACHEPLARLLGDESAEQLRRALARLAPHYRDVLILYELHDMSYLEIAGICDLDLGTVRSRLSRGRAALSRAMASYRAIDQT